MNLKSKRCRCKDSRQTFRSRILHRGSQWVFGWNVWKKQCRSHRQHHRQSNRITYFKRKHKCKRKTEKAMSKVLLNMDFQVNLKGYRYLIEMISAIVGNPELTEKIWLRLFWPFYNPMRFSLWKVNILSIM